MGGAKAPPAKMKVEFDESKFGLLLFSRGRGRGHAVPDMAIVEELQKIRDDVEVRFVSYGTGAATLAERGYPVIDLGLPEANPALETIVLAAQVIGSLEPHLVVAHEEFAAMPAAKIFGLPTVMITDWFKEPNAYSMQTLGYADEVIFLGEPGGFEEPGQAKGRVRYVGQVMCDFEYSPADRARAREELGFEESAAVVLVLPGSWTEEKVPCCELILAAFDELPRENKALIWIAGADHEAISRRTEGMANVVVKESDWQIDRLMAASDAAITKSTRKTASELAYFGVPLIALTHGLNPIDDQAMRNRPSAHLMPAGEADGQALAREIEKALEQGISRETAGSGQPLRSGRRQAAELLAQQIANLNAS